MLVYILRSVSIAFLGIFSDLKVQVQTPLWK